MFFLNISILIEHEKSMVLTFGIRLTLHTNIYSYHRNRLITESQYVSFIMQLFRNAQIDSIFEISVDIHYLVNWDFLLLASATLNVSSVDCQTKLNRKNHHTSEFEKVGNIYRRGQAFVIRVEFDREVKSDHDIILLQFTYGKHN